MKKWIEYQPQRRHLAEAERKCSCGKNMTYINFESHPLADQVWKDWKCLKCGNILKLRYFDDWIDKRITVTKRK